MKRAHERAIEYLQEEANYKLSSTVEKHVDEFERCNSSFHSFREDYIYELEEARIENRELQMANARVEAATIAVGEMTMGMAMEWKYEALIYKTKGENVARAELQSVKDKAAQALKNAEAERKRLIEEEVSWREVLAHSNTNTN